MQDVKQQYIDTLVPALREEVVDGLLYAHSRLQANTKRNLEASSFLYALVELLNEKGLIEIDELDKRQKVVGDRLSEQYKERGEGALFQEPQYEKYSLQQEAEVDCANRLHRCKAACCRLPFALSKQDIREGIVRWDLGQPYLIAQGDEGYCSHLDREGCGCTVYQHRPVPCRAFDCREDKRIWLDFEAGVVNPAIDRSDWPRCLSGGSGEQNKR